MRLVGQKGQWDSCLSGRALPIIVHRDTMCEPLMLLSVSIAFTSNNQREDHLLQIQVQLHNTLTHTTHNQLCYGRDKAASRVGRFPIKADGDHWQHGATCQKNATVAEETARRGGSCKTSHDSQTQGDKSLKQSRPIQALTQTSRDIWISTISH